MQNKVRRNQTDTNLIRPRSTVALAARSFTQPKMLVTMVLASSTNNTNNGVTQQCDTVTFRYGDLKYGCLADVVCPMRFDRQIMQALHHSHVHRLSKPFVCPVCSLERKASFDERHNEHKNTNFKTLEELRFHNAERHAT